MTESIPARKHWYSPTADVIRTSFKQFKEFIKGKKTGHEKGQPDSQPNERPIVSAVPSLKQSSLEHTSTSRPEPTQRDDAAPASRSEEIPPSDPTNRPPQVLSLPIQIPLGTPEVGLGSTDTILPPGPISTTVSAHSLKTDVKKGQSDNPGDIVMVVMGPTGVGKTTFINSFKSSYSLSKDGHHDLDSGTQDVRIVTVNLEDTGKKLVLVDTPGFDDSKRPNSEVLTCIANYLEKTYREKKYLAGLIYLHRITDIRFDSGGASSMNIFKKLYGNDGYDKLALVTTMWNDIRPDLRYKYEAKEGELKEVAWGTFLNRNNPALVARFDATDDSLTNASALEVVTGLIQNSLPAALKLRLQQELVDEGKKLPRTAAGRAAFTLAETARFYLNEIAT